MVRTVHVSHRLDGENADGLFSAQIPITAISMDVLFAAGKKWIQTLIAGPVPARYVHSAENLASLVPNIALTIR